MGKTTTKNPKAVKATEKDVLMGRGKRVSEWPGNIYFRQVVNKHREPYSDAERSKKVYVAQAVIAAIHDIGGRFLKEESDGSWTEIEHPRSIEKTCQALREKEKPNPPGSNPFEGVAFPNGPPPQKKQKLLNTPTNKKHKTADGVSVTGSTTESEDDAEDRDGDDDESSLETDTDADGTGSDDGSDDSSDDDDKEDDDDSQVAAPGLDGEDDDDFISSKIPLWKDEDMLKQLETFKRSYGNCAVPPAWTKDEDLADWSTVQRQRYREVESGYREATAAEKKSFKVLETMGFVWDYDLWHWNEKYRALAEWYKDLVAKQKAGKVQKSRPTVAPARDLVEWLQEQRRQYREANWLVPTDHVEKLRQIGVSF
jgi:hypothetical protein